MEEEFVKGSLDRIADWNCRSKKGERNLYCKHKETDTELIIGNNGNLTIKTPEELKMKTKDLNGKIVITNVEWLYEMI